MEWSQDFESGLADIDAQHRYFFELILRVDVLRKSTDDSSRRRILNELVNYTQCHFGYEARLMLAYDYPEQDKHLADHSQLLKRVEDFLAAEDPNFQKLALFLFKWFSSHTTLDDRPLATHILTKRAQTLGVPREALARLVVCVP